MASSMACFMRNCRVRVVFFFIAVVGCKTVVLPRFKSERADVEWESLEACSDRMATPETFEIGHFSVWFGRRNWKAIQGLMGRSCGESVRVHRSMSRKITLTTTGSLPARKTLKHIEIQRKSFIYTH